VQSQNVLNDRDRGWVKESAQRLAAFLQMPLINQLAEK
jgi:hypothetical protein